ncbi:MAG: hypothetical protein JWM68_5614, partial [Verrucomicrobiales bacterium]|nr:hypothetical protein [Verrucomicrobiales bacterium]
MGKQPRICLSILAALLFFLVSPLCAQTPVFTWVKTAGASTNDSAKFVTTDPQGNVIVTGYFRETVTFGQTNLTTTDGNLDGYVAKYTTNGTLIWIRQISGDGSVGDVGYGVTTDSSGNILVTGNFSGTATFGGTNLVSAGSHDMFLAKYDPSGNVLWATRAGGANDDIGLHVAVDSSGNSIVTGYFRNLCSFGTTNLNSGSSNFSDSYVAKYNSSGQLLWVRQIGGSSFDSGYVAVADAVGNIYATGYFNTSASVSGTTLTGTSDEMYLVKFDPAGTLLWARSTGSSGSDKGSSVAIDSTNGVYVSGWFQNTMAFPGTNLISRGSYDTFLAKYNVDGTFNWVRQIGGAGADFGQSVVVDNSGTICLCGDFQNTITLDNTSLTAANTNAGNSAIFLAKYDSNGTLTAAKGFGNTRNNHAHIWSANTGELYVAGNFSGSASFDGYSFNSAGDLDTMVAQLVIPPTLSFSSSGSNLSILWPTNTAGFQLQRT